MTDNFLSPPRCGMCKHPAHGYYEKLLLKGEITERAASEQMGVSIATVSRHLSGCLPRKMDGLVRPEPVMIEGLNCVKILVHSHQDLRDLFDEAREKGDIRAALKALEIEIRQVHEMAALTGQTTDGMNFNLVLNADYILLKNTVLEAVADYPEVQAKISQRLREGVKDDDKQSQF